MEQVMSWGSGALFVLGLTSIAIGLGVQGILSFFDWVSS